MNSLRSSRVVVGMTLISMLSVACGGSSASPRDPQFGSAGRPSPSLGPSAPSVGTPAPSGATFSVPSSPNAEPVLPGEAWITYSWDNIELSRPDGTGQHALRPGLTGGQGHSDWSPDGTQLVFVRTVDEAHEAIWIMNSDGSDAHEIVPEHAGCCGQDHPYWSPDGKSIAFMHWVGPDGSATSQLEVYDLTTQTIRVAATSKMPVVLDQPHWSPDGRTFAVEVNTFNRDGSCCAAGAIGLIPVATGKLTILTDVVPFAGAPDWRPDGKAIVFDSMGLSYFESTGPDQATNLYSINIDGSGLTQLTHNALGGHRATEPFWRADGTVGYVETEAQRSFNRFIRFIDADGTQLPDPASPIRATHPRIRPGT